MYAIIDNKKYRVYLKNGRYFIMKRNVVKQPVNESDVVNEPVSPPKKRTNKMLDLKILKENEEKLLGIIESLKTKLNQCESSGSSRSESPARSRGQSPSDTSRGQSPARSRRQSSSSDVSLEQFPATFYESPGYDGNEPLNQSPGRVDDERENQYKSEIVRLTEELEQKQSEIENYISELKTVNTDFDHEKLVLRGEIVYMQENLERITAQYNADLETLKQQFSEAKEGWSRVANDEKASIMSALSVAEAKLVELQQLHGDLIKQAIAVNVSYKKCEDSLKICEQRSDDIVHDLRNQLENTTRQLLQCENERILDDEQDQYNKLKISELTEENEVLREKLNISGDQQLLFDQIKETKWAKDRAEQERSRLEFKLEERTALLEKLKQQIDDLYSLSDEEKSETVQKLTEDYDAVSYKIQKIVSSIRKGQSCDKDRKDIAKQLEYVNSRLNELDEKLRDETEYNEILNQTLNELRENMASDREVIEALRIKNTECNMDKQRIQDTLDNVSEELEICNSDKKANTLETRSILLKHANDIKELRRNFNSTLKELESVKNRNKTLTSTISELRDKIREQSGTIKNLDEENTGLKKEVKFLKSRK